ncbi:MULTISPECIES: hypothetical protein [unclassified Nocardiopsis]|uniref:hypothetical protein n=1 Tax=Nocardiopsis TaxID=2013 RepID=UPI00387B3EA0
MKRIAGITLMTLAAGAALGFTAAPASAGGHEGYHGYHGHEHVRSTLFQGHHGYSGHDHGGDWGDDDWGYGYY